MITISKGIREAQARSYLTRMLGHTDTSKIDVSPEYSLKIFGGAIPNNVVDYDGSMFKDIIKVEFELTKSSWYTGLKVNFFDDLDTIIDFGTPSENSSTRYTTDLIDITTTSTPWNNDRRYWVGNSVELETNIDAAYHASNSYFLGTEDGTITMDFTNPINFSKILLNNVPYTNDQRNDVVMNLYSNSGLVASISLKSVPNPNNYYTINPIKYWVGSEYSYTANKSITEMPNFSNENTPLLSDGLYPISLYHTDLKENSAIRFEDTFRDLGTVLRTDRFYVEYTGTANWFELGFGNSYIYGKCSRILKGGHLEFEDSLTQDGSNKNRVQIILPF